MFFLIDAFQGSALWDGEMAIRILSGNFVSKDFVSASTGIVLTGRI